MKKIKFTAIFITLFFLLIGYTSVPMAFGAGDNLDKAIRDVSDYLNKRIPKDSKVVFLNVKSDWPIFSEYILDGLQENAVNDEVFTVVDRRQLDSIRAEQKFQYSGEVSSASAQEIGQLLGAQTIVSGLVTKAGSEFRIQVQATEVQTATIQGIITKNVSNKGPIVTALTTASAVSAEINAQNAVAYFNRGKEFYGKGNFNKAIAEFTQAVRLDPNNATYYQRRGTAFYMKKDYNMAIMDYSKMLQLNPGFMNGYVARGIVYSAKGDYDRAIADFNHVLDIDPNVTDVYRTRGNAYFRKKDYDRAIDDFSKLLSFDPNNSSAYDSRGMAYYYKEDYDRAITDFEAALRINPNSSKTFLELARSKRGR